jgi:hypothetical protein
MRILPFSTYLKTLVLAVLTITFMASCSKKIPFLTSSVVPAARGSVEVKNDKNKNYVIKIHLSNLAEVKRLQPSKQTYVIWMDSDQQSSKNIGQMNSSTKGMQKNLRASFQTVSSSKPNKIFVTAEDDANIQYPGTQIVISTGRF